MTTNFMGFFKPLDYFAWASELDVVSTDNYVDPADPEWPDAQRHALRPGPLAQQGRALDGDGADQFAGQLAGAQRRQGARPDAGHELPGGRPGRRGSAVFPMASVADGGGKVPLGHALALRNGLPGLG